MVPCVVRNGHNTYPNIDTYPPIYPPGRLVHGRYRRSMPIHQRENTVDIPTVFDMPIDLRRITADRQSSSKNRHNFVADLIDYTCGVLLG